MSTGGPLKAVTDAGESVPAGDARVARAAELPEARTPQEICTAWHSPFVPPAPLDKVAVAINTLGQMPLNARRVSPERGASGWYIWGGEGGGRSRTPGFFQTLQVAHLLDRCPQILPFLALAPGWRVRLSADGPDIKPPHAVAPPDNVAVRRIGARVTRPQSVKQWAWLSILLHILAIVLFGDTTGAGTQRGVFQGARVGGPLNVTLQVARASAEAPPAVIEDSPAPAKPVRRARASKAQRTKDAALDAPGSTAPKAEEDTLPTPVLPPVMAKQVEKPETTFVVPVVPEVVTPPEPPAAKLPESLPRLDTIVPPKAMEAPAIEREIALPPELIPRLTPLTPARTERDSRQPAEAPRLKTFVPPRIEPEVVPPPVEMPRIAPLTPLPSPPVQRDLARPAELLPRLPPVTPAAAIESTTRAAPVPPAPVVSDRAAEPARTTAPATPTAPSPSAPAATASPSVTPGESRVPPSASRSTSDTGDANALRGPALASPSAATPPGKAPRIDLDAVRQRAREIAREGSAPRTLLPFNVRPKEDTRTKEQQAFDKALKRPDCREAYAGMGLAAVVPLVWDAVSEKGCKWGGS